MLVISAICRQNYLMQIAPQLTSPETPDKSTIMSRTREQYASMTPDQKGDFWKATACTIAGVALNAVNTLWIEPKLERHESPIARKVPVALKLASRAFDKADGWFAKRSMMIAADGTIINPGATTDLGRRIDPLADKANNFVNEARSVYTGRLHLGLAIARWGSDGLVEYTRSDAAQRTNGEVSTGANKKGQAAQLFRAVSDAHNSLSVEPSRFNSGVQISSTALLLVSRAETIKNIERRTQAWEAARTNYHQPKLVS